MKQQKPFRKEAVAAIRHVYYKKLYRILLTNISKYDILYIAVRYIAVKLNRAEEAGLDQHIKKVYVPMTETAFYILMCLKQPNHGYGIVQTVEKLTDGAIRLAPGTMYGSLSKMEKDGLIRFVREEEKRKIYQITDLGLEVLQLELNRIERLYRVAKEAM